MSEQQNQTDDDYKSVEVAVAPNEYDDPVENAQVEVKAVDVPANPEQVEDEPEELDLTPPNNVHTNPAVHLRESPYKKLNTKGPAIVIVPKRFSRVIEKPGAWSVSKDNPMDMETAQFVENYTHGVALQHIGGYGTPNPELLGRDCFYDNLMNDPNARWQQGLIAANGDLVYGKRPKPQPAKERRVITGEHARNMNMRAMGLGDGGRKVMPHTGIVVGFRPRSTNEYLLLEEQITQDRIRSGRESLGLVFQNSQVSHVRIVWDFIRESINFANVLGFDPENGSDVDLGDVLKITDLPSLYWGQICTMYPDGYPLDLPCSAGINICKHVERILFDPDLGQWINDTRISGSQLSRLHNSAHRMTEQDLRDYAEDPISPFHRKVEVKSARGRKTELVLEVPTINEYINHGTSWMADLTAAAEQLFESNADNQQQIALAVNKSIQRSVIAEYSHWVREIIYDDYNVANKQSDIIPNLAEMSTFSEELNNDVMGLIQQFILDCTVAIIAIPNFACPVCEKDYVTDEHSEHPDLIPLDMLRHFFMVMGLRVNTPTQR